MSTTPSYKKAVSIPQTATADTTLSNAGSIIACAVVADGFTLSQTDHAGVTTTDSRTYTATGMVPEQTDGRSNTTVATRSYAYDSLGRPSTRSTAKDGITHSDVFHYTKRSELVNANLNGVQHGYDYDNIGNRRQAIEGSNYSQYTANNLNQYTDIYGSVNGQDFDFTPTFDDAGNQTLVKTDTGIWSAVYNAENRPVTFTNNESNTVVECAYDSMGRRAYKKVTTNGTVTLHQRYIYRGYLQIACIDLTRSHHPALWFIIWDSTQPIATRPLAIQINGTWHTYGWDLTKNICELYGTTGYVTTAYTYTPHGFVTGTGNVQQPIQWSSEFYDSVLALVYYNYRYYNPNMGRWINRDIFDGNDLDTLYLFVSNKSIIHTDYLGLLSVGDNCKVGTMRNFKPYAVAKDAWRPYSFDSPDDEERYALSVSMMAKISELAPTSGGAGKKVAKQLVKKNKDTVDEIFEAISDIKKDLAKNAIYIVVWYKFEAECCKCNKGFFYTTYDFEKVETEWEVYPKRKSRRDNSTSEKFLKANVMEYYAKVLKDKQENMCK